MKKLIITKYGLNSVNGWGLYYFSIILITVMGCGGGGGATPPGLPAAITCQSVGGYTCTTSTSGKNCQYVQDPKTGVWHTFTCQEVGPGDDRPPYDDGTSCQCF